VVLVVPGFAMPPARGPVRAMIARLYSVMS
jgi:hypothetical protein